MCIFAYTVSMFWVPGTVKMLTDVVSKCLLNKYKDEWIFRDWNFEQFLFSVILARLQSPDNRLQSIDNR